MNRITPSLFCLTVLACLPAGAFSQTIAHPAGLAEGLRSGDTVYISESGREVKGTVIDASATSLTVSIDGHRRAFDPALVDRLERERRAVRKGALIGLAAGAAVLATTFVAVTEQNCGPVRGTIHACDDEWSRASIIVVFGALGGGIGAAAGAGLGYAFKRRETVFARDRAASPIVRLAPIASPARRGLNVALEF